MRHCKSCKNCIVDLRAIYLCGVYIHKCTKKRHYILRPFFSGFRCKEYRKDGDGNG